MPTALLSSLSAIPTIVIGAIATSEATDNITAASNITANITSGIIAVGGSNRTTARCQVDGNFTPIYLPSIYGISLILGVLGNGAGIFCFCRHMRPWSPLTVYMLNLAASDLCYVLSLPFLIDYYVARTWRYPEWHCKLQRVIFHANMYASILFLTVIAGHRYAGIVHPLRCRGAPLAVSRRASALVSAAVWAAVAAMVLPQVRFVKLGSAAGAAGRIVTKCYDTADKEMLREYLPYSMSLSILGFFGPFCAMLFFYGSVVRALVRSSGGPEGVPWEVRAVTAADHARTRRIVAVTLVLFAFCFLPYHVMRLWNLVVRLYPPEHCSTSTNVYITYQVTRGLACLNSCLDPVLYAFARGGVRSALRESLRSVSRSELTRLSLRHLDRISALGSGLGGGGGGSGGGEGAGGDGRGGGWDPAAGGWVAGSPGLIGEEKPNGVWVNHSDKLSGKSGEEDFEEVFEEPGRTLPHR